ncbi:MAG: hypothetical protein P1V35_00955 [Planctomycetota bacterium]|nr:hypothetical protein [Planctomycetota bacterium]
MDNLIQTPGELCDSGAETRAPISAAARRLSLGALVLSALVVLSTGLVDALYPKEGAKPIGQEAREFARAQKQRAFWDGSMAKGFELDIRLRSNVRQSLAPYWSALLLKKLGVAAPGVVVGKDGWLFMRNRLHPEQATRNVAVEYTSVSLAAIDRRLNLLGSEFIVMPIPRKVVVCASMLPDGMDPDPGFEKDLIRSLRNRGLLTIDVEETWKGLPPEGMYLPQDSHWANPGIKLLAQELAELRPELVAHEVQAKLMEYPTPAPAGLLDLTSIPRGHPIQGWLAGPGSAWLYLDPHSVTEAINDRSNEFRVAAVGSSFTREFAFAEILTVEFGRLVYPGGLSGTPFAGSLAKFSRGFSTRPLPSVVFYEFPAHQSMQLGMNGESTKRSLGSFFASSSRAASVPVPTEFFPPQPPLKKVGSNMQMKFGPGHLLSTGDGVLQLRIQATGAVKSRWSLQASGPAMTWTQNSESDEFTFPILQLEGVRSPVWLAGSFGKAAQVEVQVVTDADLARAEVLPMEAAEPSLFRSANSTNMPSRNAALVIRWQGQPRSVRCSINGIDQDGDKKSVHVVFDKPRARIALLSLSPFGTGSVESIDLEGDMETPIVSIAPQLSNR